MNSMLIYGCGCGVGYDDRRVSSLSVCAAHREAFDEVLVPLAREITRGATGAPTSLDAGKVAATLERVIAAEAAELGETDGSA